jgi:predicted O-linked N-acetylglucosamine transferase (SPINDLY family)
MSEITVHQALAVALQHQRAGELREAETIYRQILQTFPDQQDAHHLLGAALFARKELQEAAAEVERAIELAPRETSFRLTLGLIYQSARRYGEALRVYDDLLAIAPDIADAHNHRGVALSVEGRHAEAAAAFKRALALGPGTPTIQGNLGVALCHVGHFEEAIWMLRSALEQAPKNATFHVTLASALYFSGQHEAAIASCREAIRLAPQRGDAYLTLSTALNALGKYEEAMEPAERAVALLPDAMESYLNLGNTLRELGRADACIAAYRAGLARDPEAAVLRNSLGNVLKDTGLLDEALAEYRQALRVWPEASIFSNYLYTMQYHPTIDPGEVYREHREFDRRFAAPLFAQSLPHTNHADPARRLRVGYLSSDFRSHALGHYLLPLFEHHDHGAFEIFCYSNVRAEDSMTFRLREHSDHWKSVRQSSDEEIAAMVRADGIDVLIDLHQHMGGSKILVYARKPAPVQMGFAGYPGTTGLSMIDYRLTDRYLEPADGFPVPSSETPILLPDTFWCYDGRAAHVAVNPLPASANGHVTFGSFNNFCKVNEPTLALWAEVMRGLPGSRLMLLAPEGSHRDRTTAYLSTQGVEPARVSFVGWQKGAAYFALYHRVDVGLDTFPYNGHTTSLDSYFMGVPVVTLAGPEGGSPVARAGWSQLVNLRLTELAGHSREEFIGIARGLAKDLPRLEELRKTLRTRMKASPLMDGARFAKNVEAAYRMAWERWCRKQG